LLVDPSGDFLLRVRGRFGARTHTLQGATIEGLEQSWHAAHSADVSDQQRPWADVSFVADGRVAVLTVRGFDRFADLNEQERMEAFFARAFREIKTRSVRALIIDVRDNGGGRDEQGRELFAYIAQRPFTYYDGLYFQGARFSFAEHAQPSVPGPPPQIYETDPQGRLRMRENQNYGTHQPEADAFAGPVFVLMNGGSFSTTAEFLSVTHANRRATLIGEEAGGGYYGPMGGVTLTLTLPHSGLRVRVPLQRYELAISGFSPASRGAPADIVIRPTIQDRLANRDPVMARALRLAQGS
jgi:C-terminal processing protease CtpA/Prc